MRDDFTKPVKDTLAKRVGFRCSNPNCRKLTSGPHVLPDKSTSIGVAAHITAASMNGPRYDSEISKSERISVENGIWLCQDCGTLVDRDPQRYPYDLLVEWKKVSEQAALLELQGKQAPKKSIKDVELIKFYSQCFDRPAFQEPFSREVSMEDFDKAISDTIIAISTGNLRARDGQTLSQSKGKSFLTNPDWREKMDSIVDLLRAIRSRYIIAVRTGQIRLGAEFGGNRFYEFRTPEVCAWMDSTRDEIIQMFAEICIEAQIKPLEFPRSYIRHRGMW